MSKKADKQQIRVFHGLLRDLNIAGQKENILSGYGVESSKDLLYTQMEQIITGLKDLRAKKYEPAPATRRLRSKVLDLLTKLDVYKDNRDWKRVNEYLMQPRIAGKLMYDMNDDELKALIRKLTAIHSKREQKIEAEKIWATQN